jgi:hypothetical protein
MADEICTRAIEGKPAGLPAGEMVIPDWLWLQRANYENLPGYRACGPLVANGPVARAVDIVKCFHCAAQFRT